MVTVKETHLKFNKELSIRRKTKMIIVHHSDTNVDVPVETIHQWHLAKGWAGVAYNYYIRHDGTIERGRPKNAVGSHAAPYNSLSVGVCLSGNFMSTLPTTKQLESLVALCAELCGMYDLTEDAVIGHRDKNATSCPGDQLYALLPDLREQIKFKRVER